MQAIGTDHETDTDTNTESTPDTESESDTPTVAPVPTCDIDILFVFDTSLSMMASVGQLTQSGFAPFTNMLAGYPQPGTIHVAITNHLYGIQAMTTGPVDTSKFLTAGWPVGMENPVSEDGYCYNVPTVDCNFASGTPWMEGPSSTLSGEFACVGSLPCQENPTAGEQTLQAGYEALLHPDNEGFIRDNALLSVIYLTDEDDQSALTLQSIRDGLLALKEDQDLEASSYVYVASLSGPQTGGSCDSAFYGETQATPSNAAFVGLFGTKGQYFNMCSASVPTALSQISAKLQQGCKDVLGFVEE